MVVVKTPKKYYKMLTVLVNDGGICKFVTNQIISHYLYRKIEEMYV